MRYHIEDISPVKTDIIVKEVPDFQALLLLEYGLKLLPTKRMLQGLVHERKIANKRVRLAPWVIL